MKNIILILISTFLFSCSKDNDLNVTGSIELQCTDSHYVGVQYSVFTEYEFFNNSNKYGSFALKNGTVEKITKITDLNPGNYIISFYYPGWINVNKAVQVATSRTNVYTLSVTD